MPLSSSPPVDNPAATASRGRPWWPWVAGVGLVLAVAVAVALARLDPWLRRELEQQASRQSHGAYQLRIGALHTHLWTRSLVITQVQLLPDPRRRGAWPAALPQLRLTLGTARLSGVGVLAALRGGVVPVDSLVLSELTVDVPAGLPPRFFAKSPALYQRLPRRIAGLRLGLLALRRVRARYAAGPDTLADVARADLAAHDVLLSAAGAADTQRTAYAATLTARPCACPVG